MSEEKSIRDRAGIITHEEAREILNRFNNSHWRNRNQGETARYTIPADPRRDDDIRLGCYIDQSEELQSELTALRQECGVLRRALESSIKELNRVTTVKDGQPNVSHNLIYNLNEALNQSPISAKQQAIQETYEKIVKAANNVTVLTTTDFNKHWANELHGALNLLDSLKSGDKPSLDALKGESK